MKYGSLLLLLMLTLGMPIEGQVLFEESLRNSLGAGVLEEYSISLDGTNFGKSMWFRRADKAVKAKYFSSDNPYETFRSWQRNSHEILGVCSGDYLGLDANSGLSINNGQITSRRFNPEMDGLVIVEEIGGIRVVNLEKSDITVYYGKGNSQPRTKKRLDPGDAADLEELLTWSVESNATLFQTHLLAWKDKVKPDVFKNSAFNKSKSPKRFLALVYDDLNDLHFVVLDVDRSVPLGKAAIYATKYFIVHRKVASLVALINLNRPGGHQMRTYFNRHNISRVDQDRLLQAHNNLLVFYR